MRRLGHCFTLAILLFTTFSKLHAQDYLDKYPAKVIREKEMPKIALSNIETKINIENREVHISWQYQNKDDTKGVVVFRKSQEERLRPVSGLIRDKKYVDKTTETNVDYIYLLISYSHEGNKWTSSEHNATLKED